MEQTLPHAEFFRQLIEFAQQCEIGGMSDYIGDDARQLPDKLRSTYDNEKRFNGPDQPVVSISWYAARAYCLWLGALEKPIEGDAEVEYRLPREYEWQWAAGKGNERAYPWDNGEPTEKRANYDQNIGATTTVDSYPDGATPEGLMDMAGNVFEWMANYYDDDKDYVSLRGGSWDIDASRLRCSARLYFRPVFWSVTFGFRVVCSQSLKTG